MALPREATVSGNIKDLSCSLGRNTPIEKQRLSTALPKLAEG